jgi:hypothetical protein
MTKRRLSQVDRFTLSRKRPNWQIPSTNQNANEIMLLAQANQLWYTMPLIVSVSLVYAATRHEDMPSILQHAVRFAAWIAVFLAGLGVILWWLGRGL